MSAGVSQSISHEQSKRPFLIDGLSCVGALGGTIASLVTQQVMFATVPLSVMFAVQVMNRYRQEQNLSQAQSRSFLAIEQLKDVTNQLNASLRQHEDAIHSLELDTSHHCINVFNLENLIKQKDQDHTYQLDRWSAEVKAQLTELDDVVVKLRGIVADGTGHVYSSAEAHYKRGLNQEELGNLDAAVSDYTQVLEQDPSHANACMRRGLAYLELGQKQAALLDLNAAARYFFSEGDLQSYQMAKDKVNAVHQAEHDAKKVHASTVKLGAPGSVNALFG